MLNLLEMRGCWLGYRYPLRLCEVVRHDKHTILYAFAIDASKVAVCKWYPVTVPPLALCGADVLVARHTLTERPRHPVEGFGAIGDATGEIAVLVRKASHEG